MDRDCDRCIHHISGACSSWDCEMMTIEGYRAKVIDEMVDGIRRILECNAIYNIDCIDTLAKQMKDGE